MVYLGNEEILKNYKIAFFCSGNCPDEIVQKSRAWAVKQRKNGNCVVLAANTKVEKEVFCILLNGKQPLILLPGCGNWKNWGERLLVYVNRQRLIAIKFFHEVSSEEMTDRRTDYIMSLADEIVIAHCTPGGSIARAVNRVSGKKIWYLANPEMPVIKDHSRVTLENARVFRKKTPSFGK